MIVAAVTRCWWGGKNPAPQKVGEMFVDDDLRKNESRVFFLQKKYR
jgi:hypothetical protein